MPSSATDPAPLVPHQPETEQALLSQLFIDPARLIPECIRRGMTPDWYYIPAYRLVYNTLLDLYNANTPCDATSVVAALRNNNKLDAVGGMSGIMDIIATSTSTALYKHHCRILKQAYTYRRLIDVCTQTIDAAYAQTAEADTLVDAAETAVLSIRNEEDKGTGSFNDILKEVLTNVEAWMKAPPNTILGLPTGFNLLDRKTNGLHGGELIVIAARPSMGKTALLLSMLANIVANTGRYVLFFSLEMSAHSLAERLLFAAAGVSKTRLMHERSRGISREMIHAVGQGFKRLKGKPYHICDKPAMTIAAVRAYARRTMHEHPDLCCIGVDYIQLMRSTTKQAQGNREREVAEISAGLKALAKELNIPVIALAQLNRSAETRAGKNKGIPMMSDLRESGAIEQDADLIGLLHRPEYYADNDNERARLRGEAHLNLAKNRNGATGDIPLYFNAELMQFTNPA